MVSVMNYRKCNPLYGYRWLAEGIKLFFSQPWPWLALVGVSLLLLLVLALLPLLGLVGIFTVFPGIVAGFLLASRDAMARQAINFRHLLAGFRIAAKPLVGLGSLVFLIFFMVLVFVLMGWHAEFQQLVALMQSPTPDKAAVLSASAQLTQPSLIILAAMLLLTVAAWFAPALVVFRQVEARAALALSLRASLGNFAPFLVFCVLLLLLNVTLSFILRLALAAFLSLGGEQIAQSAAMLFSFPIVCGFLAIIFAAAYVSYQDVFESKPNQ